MYNVLIEVPLVIVLAILGYLGSVKFLEKREFDLLILKNKKLIITYLVVNIGIGLSFIYLFQTIYVSNPLLQQVKLLVLICILIPTAVVDYFVQLIPNIFILIALLIRGIIFILEFVVAPETAWIALKDGVLSAVIIAGFFLLISLVFKNSIGMGDVKLFAVMGLYQGIWGTINSVFFSLVASFFVSLFLLVSKKKNRKDSISFAPSILIGTLIAIGLSGM